MLVAIHRIEWMVKVAEANIRAIPVSKSPRMSGVDFVPPVEPQGQGGTMLIPMYRKKLGLAA
jgi:hypothetical protein